MDLPNYDNWKLSSPNDDEKIFCECAECGGEIYVGEEVFEIDFEYIHEDCLDDYARRVLEPRRTIAGDD